MYNFKVLHYKVPVSYKGGGWGRQLCIRNTTVIMIKGPQFIKELLNYIYISRITKNRTQGASVVVIRFRCTCLIGIRNTDVVRGISHCRKILYQPARDAHSTE